MYRYKYLGYSLDSSNIDLLEKVINCDVQETDFELYKTTDRPEKGPNLIIFIQGRDENEIFIKAQEIDSAIPQEAVLELEEVGTLDENPPISLFLKATVHTEGQHALKTAFIKVG